MMATARSRLGARVADAPPRTQQRLWKAASVVAAAGAGLVVRNLVSRAWTSRTGSAPPSNPADPAVAWPRALAWAAGMGVAVGIARTVGQRGAAKAWTRTTGMQPPGFHPPAAKPAW